MRDFPKQSQEGSEHRTAQQIMKELLIVCIWIGFGTVTLWVADGFGLLSSTSHAPSATPLQVDFPEVHQIWKHGEAVFVDTRSAANFRRGHIPDAVNVPINRVRQTLSALPTDKEVLLITYCGSIECPNAYQLMNVLLRYGYRNVKFFPRGIRGWQALGYPLETE